MVTESPCRALNAVGLSIHGASTGRGCAIPALTAYAAKIPPTARELTISPLNTRCTASAMGYHCNVMSASSSCASGRPTSVKPVAR